MIQTSKFIFLGLLTVVCAAPAAALDKIKIGVSTPLTGPAATYGVDVKNLLQFANDSLTQNSYELIIEDDMCDPAEAVKIAHKFAQIDKVKYVVGMPCSGTILAAAPIYETAKITVIAFGSSPKISDSGEYIFRTRPSEADAVKVLYRYLAAINKRIAVVYEQTEGASTIASAFFHENSGLRLTLYPQEFLSDSTDLKPLLLRLKAKDPETMIIFIQTEQAMLNIVRQLHELNWNLPLYANAVADSPTFLKLAGDAGDGLVVVSQPNLPAGLPPDGQLLFAQYVAQFGPLKSMDLFFLTTLLSIDALHRAISAGGDVKSNLLHQTFGGMLGSYSFDSKGDILGLPFVLKRAKAGRFVDLPAM